MPVIRAATVVLALLEAALGCGAPAMAQFFDEGNAASYWTLERQRQEVIGWLQVVEVVHGGGATTLTC